MPDDATLRQRHEAEREALDAALADDEREQLERQPRSAAAGGGGSPGPPSSWDTGSAAGS